MIGQEFKKKVGNSTAVHVKAMIHRSTQITKWVSDTILNETDAKKRAHMIKFWIKVGDVSLTIMGKSDKEGYKTYDYDVFIAMSSTA